MPKLIFLAFFGCFFTFVICGRTEIFTNGNKYLPTWESLDSRPLPQWYDDAKFGIFFHWGVYSVPGFGSEWFWSNWNISEPNIENFMKERFPPGFTYQQFAPDFTAEFFNATRWADIIFKSNAKYVVLTSKHHEGFTLWPSSRAFSWNAKDVGPHRDIIEELSTAVRKRKLVFGVYYSLYEWFNPIYLADKMSNFTKRNYVTEKMLPELNELIYNYKPEIIWSDGDWEASEDYFKSKDFLAWLYNESPVRDTVIANDRWGRDIPCHHGDVYTCTDRYNPGVLQNHKWENCMTVDKKSWGFRRNAELSDYKTVHELITDLSSTVSCGGNLLMNIGPTRDGMIAPIFQDRLEGIGKWLDVNGEAIFKTTPWVYQNDTIDGQVWYTSKPIKNSQKNRIVYAIVLKWPKDNVLNLGALSQRLKIGKSVIVILGNDNSKLEWQEKDDSVQITFPDMASLKSQIAWSLKITNIVSTSEKF